MRHLLPLVLLSLAACAGSLESHLRDARDSTSVPADLRVVYDDHDTLSGGDRIEISGDGRMRIWRFRPGFVSATDTPEQALGEVEIETSPSTPPTEERTLTQDDLSSLVSVLLEVEPWEQITEPDDVRLDRRRAVLRAQLAGSTSTCWEWADEVEAEGSHMRRFLRWTRTHGAAVGVDVQTPVPPEPEAETQATQPAE